jgi:hypothetical protein
MFGWLLRRARGVRIVTVFMGRGNRDICGARR